MAADGTAASDLVGENVRTPTKIPRWGDTTALATTSQERRYSTPTLKPSPLPLSPEEAGEMKLNAQWKTVRAVQAAWRWSEDATPFEAEIQVSDAFPAHLRLCRREAIRYIFVYFMGLRR